MQASKSLFRESCLSWKRQTIHKQEINISTNGVVALKSSEKNRMLQMTTAVNVHVERRIICWFVIRRNALLLNEGVLVARKDYISIA